MKISQLIPFLLVTAITSAHSQVVTSFNGVKWSFETDNNVLKECKELQLDVMGEFQRGNSFVASGALNCTFGTVPGSIATLGHGYFTPVGVVLLVKIPNGYQVNCELGPKFSGSCKLKDIVASDIGVVTLLLK